MAPADVQSYTGAEPVFITPITIAELTFGVEMAIDSEIKRQRIVALERLMEKPCLIVNMETGVVFGKIATQLRKQGRGADFRVQDLWIAALAIQNGFSVLTRNAKDFDDIPGLSLLVVHG